VYKNKTEIKQLKQKERKRQKKKSFANLKEQDYSQWCNLPKLRKLHGAREWCCGVKKNLGSWKMAVVTAFVYSMATILENSLDDTKQIYQFIRTPSAK
jgi:hypothetical protein